MPSCQPRTPSPHATDLSLSSSPRTLFRPLVLDEMRAKNEGGAVYIVYSATLGPFYEQGANSQAYAVPHECPPGEFAEPLCFVRGTHLKLSGTGQSEHSHVVDSLR